MSGERDSEVLAGTVVPAGPPPGSPDPRAVDLVARWLVTLRSGNTRAAYARDLGGVAVARPGTAVARPQPGRVPPWLEFCAVTGLDPLAVAPEHVATWARVMEQAGLKASTVARRLAAVSSWYSWVVDRGDMEVNPAGKLPRPYVDPDSTLTPGLTRDQALALIEAADATTGHGTDTARNSALIAVLIYTGARISELLGATTADLSEDRGHRVLLVTRKRGKRQPLVLPPPALERLNAYLSSRPGGQVLARPGETGQGRPLFATSTGRPLRAGFVWQLLRTLAPKAGLSPELVARICAHAMRHTYATLALDAGAALQDVQDGLGHDDPRTTQRYNRARGRLDRSPGYALAASLAAGGGQR